MCSRSLLPFPCGEGRYALHTCWVLLRPSAATPTSIVSFLFTPFHTLPQRNSLRDNHLVRPIHHCTVVRYLFSSPRRARIRYLITRTSSHFVLTRPHLTLSTANDLRVCPSSFLFPPTSVLLAHNYLPPTPSELPSGSSRSIRQSAAAFVARDHPFFVVI